MKIVKNFTFLLLFIFITSLDLSVHAAARPGAAARFGLRDGHVPMAALAAVAAARPPSPAVALPAPAAAALPPAIPAGSLAPIAPAPASGQARRPASPAAESGGAKRLRVDQAPTSGGASGEVKKEKDGKGSDKVGKERIMCVICQETTDEDDKEQPFVKKFTCIHPLHKECFGDLLKHSSNPRCPLCNAASTKFTEELKTAIKSSNEEKVVALLKIEEEIKDAIQIAPELLFLAILIGNYSIIHALLDAGFDYAKRINIKRKIFECGEDEDDPILLDELLEDPSAFELAAWLGLHEIVRKCSEKDTEGNNIVLATNSEGELPLHFASSARNANEIFKKMGDQLAKKGISSRWVKYDADLQSVPKTIEFLLNKNPETKDASAADNWTPLHSAALEGSVEAIIVLKKFGADINAGDDKGRTPLHFAARHDHTAAIEELCKGDEKGENGAAPDCEDFEGNTPLHYAARKGAIKAIIQLRKDGEDINAENKNGETPLHLAAKHNQAAAIEELCKGDEKGENRAAPDCEDSEGNTPLHYAARKGAIKAIIQLRKDGANINAVNGEGKTPLHLAAEYNRAGAIQELCKGDEKGEHKAAIECKDSDGNTPLHCAATEGSAKAIIQLRKSGAKVNAVNNYDETPLHCAAMNGQTRAIEKLCESDEKGEKAEINCKDSEGNTPLHRAVLRGFIGAINRLKDHGANFDAINKENKTPLDLARERHIDGRMIKILRANTTLPPLLSSPAAGGVLPVLHSPPIMSPAAAAAAGRALPVLLQSPPPAPPASSAAVIAAGYPVLDFSLLVAVAMVAVDEVFASIPPAAVLPAPVAVDQNNSGTPMEQGE